MVLIKLKWFKNYTFIEEHRLSAIIRYLFMYRLWHEKRYNTVRGVSPSFIIDNIAKSYYYETLLACR